jgi:hypothetical protein
MRWAAVGQRGARRCATPWPRAPWDAAGVHRHGHARPTTPQVRRAAGGQHATWGVALPAHHRPLQSLTARQRHALLLVQGGAAGVGEAGCALTSRRTARLHRHAHAHLGWRGLRGCQLTPRERHANAARTPLCMAQGIAAGGDAGVAVGAGHGLHDRPAGDDRRRQ